MIDTKQHTVTISYCSFSHNGVNVDKPLVLLVLVTLTSHFDILYIELLLSEITLSLDIINCNYSRS